MYIYSWPTMAEKKMRYTENMRVIRAKKHRQKGIETIQYSSSFSRCRLIVGSVVILQIQLWSTTAPRDWQCRENSPPSQHPSLQQSSWASHHESFHHHLVHLDLAVVRDHRLFLEHCKKIVSMNAHTKPVIDEPSICHLGVPGFSFTAYTRGEGRRSCRTTRRIDHNFNPESAFW